MRISATVEISNRLLPALNMSKRRSEISYLSIGFVSNKKDNVFILHQTIRNSVGVKYKVCNNIMGIFDKFLSQGKLTIRFNQPQVDLIVKGESKKVKEFLQVLKCSLASKGKAPRLSNLMNAPTKVINEPAAQLVKIVKGKKTLPSYPRSLEYLELSECCLKKFDNRILRLQHLKVLNLSNNALESLPNQMELLPYLEMLVLNENKLSRSNFSWLRAETLRKTLRVLELKNNEIKNAPDELIYLRELATLNLDHNGMIGLPKRIGNLSKLRRLTISHNNIAVFPGSFVNLKLSYLDYSFNVFVTVPCEAPTQDTIPHFPSLLELGGKAVLKERLFYDQTTLPRTLISMLDNSGMCCCGTPSFSPVKKYYYFCQMVLQRICSNYYCSLDARLPLLSFNPCGKCPKEKRIRYYSEADQVPAFPED